jgi:hypothetical protein
MNFIFYKAELAEESIIIPIFKTGDKTDCSNYRDISRLSTIYRILSDILLSNEITADQQYGLRSNKSTTDHIFCIRHILNKKWEYNEQCISYLSISRKPMN